MAMIASNGFDSSNGMPSASFIWWMRWISIEDAISAIGKHQQINYETATSISCKTARRPLP